MRPLRASIVAAGILTVGVAPGAAEAFTGSYDQLVNDGGKVTTAKVYIRGKEFRVEASVMGHQAVMIRNRDGLFHYMPGMNVVTKVPEQMDDSAILSDAGDTERYLRQRQGAKIGTETVNGYPCDVFSISDPKTGPGRVWIWQTHGFLVKMEAGGKVLEHSNIQLGASVPSDAFKVPANAMVMDSGMLGNLQGLLGQ